MKSPLSLPLLLGGAAGAVAALAALLLARPGEALWAAVGAVAVLLAAAAAAAALGRAHAAPLAEAARRARTALDADAPPSASGLTISSPAASSPAASSPAAPRPDLPDPAASATPDTVVRLLDALAQALTAERGRGRTLQDRGRDEAARADAAQIAAERAARRDQVRGEGMVSAAGTLEEVSQHIKDAAEDLGHETDQVTEGASFQHDQVAQAARAMEDMAHAVVEVSENAAQTALVADKTRDQAKLGADVVGRAVAAVSTVRTHTLTLRQRITGLGERAESIGKVMGVISDIADQTNLLALNAAIEAARAGDAGRGFAVVADEVRKLAEKTMQATGEVGQVVRAIQDDIKNSVQEMQTAAGAVEQASQLGEESGRSLTEIVGLVDATTDQIRAIATAAEEQSSVGEEVRRSVERVRDVSERTVAGMGRAGQALGRLRDQVQELSKLYGVFRLIGEGKAQALVETMAESEAMRSLDQGRMEELMRRTVREHPFLELVYVTDAKGRQITENVAPPDFQAKYAKSAFGRDWSSRPWYQGAARNKGVYVSPIYLSEASDDWCLTISTPLFEGDRVIGVLAADIRLFA